MTKYKNKNKYPKDWHFWKNVFIFTNVLVFLFFEIIHYYINKFSLNGFYFSKKNIIEIFVF